MQAHHSLSQAQHSLSHTHTHTHTQTHKHTHTHTHMTSDFRPKGGAAAQHSLSLSHSLTHWNSNPREGQQHSIHCLFLPLSHTHTVDFRPKGGVSALTKHYFFTETLLHGHESGPRPPIELKRRRMIRFDNELIITYITNIVASVSKVYYVYHHK